MKGKSVLTIDIDRVRKAAAPIFNGDIEAWSKKARVSIPTLRNFLKGQNIKVATVEKIIRPVGIELSAVLQINGRSVA